jgi:hypothetical protein
LLGRVHGAIHWLKAATFSERGAAHILSASGRVYLSTSNGEVNESGVSA